MTTSYYDAPERSPYAAQRSRDGVDERRRTANEEAVETILLRDTSSVVESLVEYLTITQSKDPVADAVRFLKSSSSSSSPPPPEPPDDDGFGPPFDPDAMMAKLTPLLAALHERILGQRLRFLQSTESLLGDIGLDDDDLNGGGSRRDDTTVEESLAEIMAKEFQTLVEDRKAFQNSTYDILT